MLNYNYSYFNLRSTHAHTDLSWCRLNPLDVALIYSLEIWGAWSLLLWWNSPKYSLSTILEHRLTFYLDLIGVCLIIHAIRIELLLGWSLILGRVRSHHKMMLFKICFPRIIQIASHFNRISFKVKLLLSHTGELMSLAISELEVWSTVLLYQCLTLVVLLWYFTQKSIFNKL